MHAPGAAFAPSQPNSGPALRPLQDLCIEVVAANFHNAPHLGELADAPVGKKIIQALLTDIDLELAGTVGAWAGGRMRCGASVLENSRQVPGRFPPGMASGLQSAGPSATSACRQARPAAEASRQGHPPPPPPQLIKDEDYWWRRACSRWKNCEAASHGHSWKQLFFERYLQEALEGWGGGDVVQLRRLMAFSRRFVQSLHVRQLPSHLDLQLLFDCMVKWAASWAAPPQASPACCAAPAALPLLPPGSACPAAVRPLQARPSAAASLPSQRACHAVRVLHHQGRGHGLRPRPVRHEADRLPVPGPGAGALRDAGRAVSAGQPAGRREGAHAGRRPARQHLRHAPGPRPQQGGLARLGVCSRGACRAGNGQTPGWSGADGRCSMRPLHACWLGPSCWRCCCRSATRALARWPRCWQSRAA
jgi:hypothetical protein